MKAHALWARRKLLALGLMLLMPIALSVAARTAAASGYTVTTGIDGRETCNPIGDDDCPD